MSAKKILIADDVNFSLEYSKAYFDQTNYSVLTAVNGEDALDLVKKERPALVLTDLFMPVMNGDEMCRAIKADPSLRNIPVVMFTSSSKEEDKNKCFEAGCDDFIKKPILSIEAFFDRIRRFIPDIRYREYPRVPIETAVSYHNEGKECSANATDISEGGMYVKCDTILSNSDNVALSFKVPSREGLIEAKGKVARIITSRDNNPNMLSGMGIQFLHVDIDDRRAIREYVRVNSK